MKSKAQVSEIKESLHPYLERVERLIVDYLQSDIELLNATNHLLRQRPGKMLRPMLGLLCAGAAGSINEDSVRFAAASELLHNATLLHDDVVDGATERRGRPTVAQLISGPAAVLIGDFWLVRAVRTIMESTHNKDRIINIFAETLGHLAEGELLQMEKAGKADTIQEDYERIIFGKTASLFQTAAVSAALSVDAPEKTVETLGLFAKNLGIAFQIKDDIMDYASGEAAIGKPTGTDLREQKITQPLLCALAANPSKEAEIRAKVAQIADKPALAEEVRAFVLENDGVSKAVAVQDKFIGSALSQLETLADTPEKLYLAKLAQFVGAREN